MENKSILVVDDEPEMRVAVAHALTHSGYSVATAANGDEALERVRSQAFRMVITDVKMPRMSGMEFLLEVRKIAPQVPVIMMTAYGTIGNAVEAMKRGACDYLIKPFSTESLEAVVSNAWRGDRSEERIAEAEPALRPSPEAKRIITQDASFLRTLEYAQTVAASNATVLIQGESGTGKELLAAYIHQHSSQREKPYIAVNCAALPETLAESELFGHEKGSFTGAVTRKVGKFELANYGTILLDEVSETPLALQAKLLRVIQEREIDRVGGTRPVPVQLRIIAISNLDLKKAVGAGKFREDLFYRLNVVPLCIPPLRERKADIPLLARHFLERYRVAYQKEMRILAEETQALLAKYDWKGNVRELENSIERAVLLGKGEVLLPKHLFLETPRTDAGGALSVKAGVSVREMEKQLIFQTLKEVQGNRTHAARLLGISIRTLRNKLREYGGEIEGCTGWGEEAGASVAAGRKN